LRDVRLRTGSDAALEARGVHLLLPFAFVGHALIANRVYAPVDND
jgi:hypothetical protein